MFQNVSNNYNTIDLDAFHEKQIKKTGIGYL